MKKYKLKQWYPSLKQDWSKGDIAEWFDGYYWNKGKVILNGLSKHEVENNPDFWELIEEPKPFFITKDGVELFDELEKVYSVNKHFEVNKNAIRYFINNDYEIFFHESNADDYIWKNKPVFSYEDFIKWGNVPYQRVIEQLAKERT